MQRPDEQGGGQAQAARVRRHGPTHALVGESPGIRTLRTAIRAVAPTRSTVLLSGETGTGKGLVARLLHELSGAERFVHLDCASLSPSLVESELFGHERGAFTGAGERRIGRLEWVGGGTLFLDEVSEVDPQLQAKLLRVLQDRSFERVGGNETRPFRARVVAASNRDLAVEIAAGRFRADLYYRLQVVELHLPPLRERPGDLPLLFREAVARRYGPGLAPACSREFHARLAAHAWPGNVRELCNLVERLALVNPSGPWRRSDLAELLRRPDGQASGPVRSEAVLSRRRFEAMERAELARLLECHRWNVSAAARALGISRGGLRGRMTRLGLESTSR